MTRKPIPQQFPPANTPFFGANNTLNPVWYRYFVNSFQREGGAQDDIYLLLIGLLTASTQQGANTREFDTLSDAISTLQSLVYGKQDATAKIAAMEDELAALRAEILARKAYDGQIEDLRVNVESLRLEATNLQQHQRVIVKSTESAISTAQTLGIGQAQTAFSQYTQLTASITGVADTVSGLTTTNIPEGTRLYYTDARARAAISASGSLSYNSSTGVMSYTTPSNSATASALQTARNIAITGDLAWNVNFDGSANVTAVGTLATVNANIGSFGSSTAIPTFTVNGKGLITAASTAVVIAPAGTLTGSTLAAGVTASSLTSLGTLTSLSVGGNVSISATGAGVTTTMSGEGATSYIVLRSTADANAGSVVLRKSRGTIASPTVISAGDTLGAVSGQAYTGAAFTAGVALQFINEETGAVSSSANGTKVRISATPVGSGTQVNAAEFSATNGMTMFALTTIDKNSLLVTRVNTVAGLTALTGVPNGAIAIASDANAPVKGNVVTGGGAVRTEVNYDGTNWRVS